LNIFVKNTTSFLNILHNIGKVINSAVRLQDCTLPAKKVCGLICAFFAGCVQCGWGFSFSFCGREEKTK
jgi:hypothetical protein